MKRAGKIITILSWVVGIIFIGLPLGFLLSLGLDKFWSMWGKVVISGVIAFTVLNIIGHFIGKVPDILEEAKKVTDKK
jgi:fatty acid desaturase